MSTPGSINNLNKLIACQTCSPTLTAACFLLPHALCFPLQVLTTAVAEPTELKLNPLYDKIYNVGLNTMFASIIPFLSLFYFNVYTVIGE